MMVMVVMRRIECRPEEGVIPAVPRVVQAVPRVIPAVVGTVPTVPGVAPAVPGTVPGVPGVVPAVVIRRVPHIWPVHPSSGPAEIPIVPFVGAAPGSLGVIKVNDCKRIANLDRSIHPLGNDKGIDLVAAKIDATSAGAQGKLLEPAVIGFQNAFRLLRWCGVDSVSILLVGRNLSERSAGHCRAQQCQQSNHFQFHLNHNFIPKFICIFAVANSVLV